MTRKAPTPTIALRLFDFSALLLVVVLLLDVLGWFWLSYTDSEPPRLHATGFLAGIFSCRLTVESWKRILSFFTDSKSIVQLLLGVSCKGLAIAFFVLPLLIGKSDQITLSLLLGFTATLLLSLLLLVIFFAFGPESAVADADLVSIAPENLAVEQGNAGQKQPE